MERIHIVAWRRSLPLAHDGSSGRLCRFLHQPRPHRFPMPHTSVSVGVADAEEDASSNGQASSL